MFLVNRFQKTFSGLSWQQSLQWSEACEPFQSCCRSICCLLLVSVVLKWVADTALVAKSVRVKFVRCWPYQHKVQASKYCRQSQKAVSCLSSYTHMQQALDTLLFLFLCSLWGLFCPQPPPDPSSRAVPQYHTQKLAFQVATHKRLGWSICMFFLKWPLTHLPNRSIIT